MKRNVIYWLLGLLVLLAIITAIYLSNDLRMIGNYLWRIFVFLIIIPIALYSLISAFTTNKIRRWVIIIIYCLGALLWYYERGVDKSIQPTYTDSNSQYDGTKNDPNLK